MRRPPVRDDVALMEGYHSPQLSVEVRLNTNEAPVPPPASFASALATAIEGVAWHRYPDRTAAALRARIGEVEGGFPVPMVFAANGSNEVLQTLCLTYAGAGRTVVVAEPTYALHSHIARLTGATVVDAHRSEDFTLDLSVLEAAIRRERPVLTFLCSPNNPTGMVESESTIRRVLEVVGEVGGLLVVDEAYGQFAPFSALALVDDDTPLVVTRTFSKTWSAAGLRLGYLIGPTWVVGELERVVLPYHLDAVKQLAGALALDFLPEMQARVAELVEERRRVTAALGSLPVRCWPSAANFILFRPTSADGDSVWRRLVDEHSVLVRNCSSWPGLDGCLRVTLGTREEDDRFLEGLEMVLGSST